MKLTLAAVTQRKSTPKSEPAELLTQQFATRCAQYAPLNLFAYPTESALLAATQRRPGHPAAALILFAIGPADGWSSTALAHAARSFSFGRITLPHELARAVAAEQIYRALTILAGHPYHSGH